MSILPFYHDDISTKDSVFHYSGNGTLNFVSYRDFLFACTIGLAHCRHLRTVRTHLSGLVDANVIGLDASESLTAEKWASFMEAGKVSQMAKLN